MVRHGIVYFGWYDRVTNRLVLFTVGRPWLGRLSRFNDFFDDSLERRFSEFSNFCDIAVLMTTLLASFFFSILMESMISRSRDIDVLIDYNGVICGN